MLLDSESLVHQLSYELGVEVGRRFIIDFPQGRDEFGSACEKFLEFLINRSFVNARVEITHASFNLRRF